MAGEPTNSWDMRVLAASEGTFGTTPALAAAQFLECINLALGPAAELGKTRPKQDRQLGRGWTSQFVTGRVEAIPFEVLTSYKTRSANDADPKELALLKAAGLHQVVNAGVSQVFTLPADPIGAADFAGVSLFRGFGPDLYRYEAEQLRGGVVRQLMLEGGDKEVLLKASGAGIGKSALGYIASVTLADGVGLTLVLSETDSRKIGPGYYKIENEIIQVQGTNANQGDVNRTIARAQLGSTGAAHAAKPMVPHMPPGLTGTGVPVSEANCTVSIDGVSHRALAFGLTIDTGMDLLPGETGSAYIQGVKATRSKVSGTVKMNLLKEYTQDIGKAVNRKSVVISIVCGATVGGIVTISLPQSELRPFAVPDTPNDVAVVDLPFEAFDSATGNDQLTLTLT